MSELEVKIKLFDKNLPLPKKHSSGAACFDLYSRIDINIQPQSIGYIPLNVAMAPPPGYWVMIAARSSLHKSGLWLANGIGIGDNDFAGGEDEYKIAAYNFTDGSVAIEKGQRIAQAMILPIVNHSIVQVDSMQKLSRGGFGSTGKH